MRTEIHPAYILHRRPYRETSLILECLSAEYGRVGVVARGARRTGKRRADPVQAFQKYHAAWSGRSELATLTRLEPVGRAIQLNAERLYSGFYINELTLRLTGRHDPNPELFSIYEQTLESLGQSSGSIEATLRKFERTILEICGYGLQLTTEAVTGDQIDPSKTYRYVVEQGPLPPDIADEGFPVAGDTLLALAETGEYHAESSKQAKSLMRFILRHYIGDKPLASRALFRKPGTTENDPSSHP